MCKFENTEVGEKLLFKTRSGSCPDTGEDISGLTFNCIYGGHITDGIVYDKLEIVDDIRCPSCGKKMIDYYVPCDDNIKEPWPFSKKEKYNE